MYNNSGCMTLRHFNSASTRLFAFMASRNPEQTEPTESTSNKPISYKNPTQNASWNDWWRATKTIKPDDFRTIDKIPCARQSLLYGITGGTAVGCTRYLTTNVFIASNWAVAGFVLIAAASWQRCKSIQASQKAQVQAIREQLARKSLKQDKGDNGRQ